MEAIEKYLKTGVGVSGVPLAYVVRKEQTVPAPNTDPATNYNLKQDKMIARDPQLDANNWPHESFKNNCHKVYNILMRMTD